VTDPVRRLVFAPAEARDASLLLAREWLVTNGLGGFAAGTLAGAPARRYHGLLVAALPAPLGRTVMLNHVEESLVTPDGGRAQVGGLDRVPDTLAWPGSEYLSEFRLELGLPVWCYTVGGAHIEKRVTMIHQQNTVHVAYTLRAGAGPVRIELAPALQFRSLEEPVRESGGAPYTVTAVEEKLEVSSPGAGPPLRLELDGRLAAFSLDRRRIEGVNYRTEAQRGYPSVGELWSPGTFSAEIDAGSPVTLVASTEAWETARALSPDEARAAERERRRRLVAGADPAAREGIGAELVLAADQFVIAPIGRTEDAARARAAGQEARSVIAGYHWFTDWGRDTMISLEGLTCSTGRFREGGWILRTFAQYVRDGLIPNMFPDGASEGLYHTADASLWFFHALDRYLTRTGDQVTLETLLPRLDEIVARHLGGTAFGIHVDPRDGLLVQGAEGFQLTWMDAKCGDWVVTPRRGKAVEINALWYNALRLAERWRRAMSGEAAARPLQEHAEACRRSFNERFWYAAGDHLYDVVESADLDGADDPACRPNQLFSISLGHPVLDESRWTPVLGAVQAKLLTPVGLRSLSPDHPDFKLSYHGDLLTRDAAYHQGTVWAWLIGPFVDAWLRVHPQDRAGARRFLEGFVPHLDQACVGSISEVFDAVAPFTPRGCVAQAWSVAEVLRGWIATAAEA
jgi:predicted glycogen debranching enzyme